MCQHCGWFTWPSQYRKLVCTPDCIFFCLLRAALLDFIKLLRTTTVLQLQLLIAVVSIHMYIFALWTMLLSLGSCCCFAAPCLEREVICRVFCKKYTSISGHVSKLAEAVWSRACSKHYVLHESMENAQGYACASRKVWFRRLTQIK